jgi:hypothetical protein
MIKRFFSDARDKNEFLKEKEEELNKQLEFNKKEIELLKSEINTAINNYSLMKLTLEIKIKTLEDETQFYTNENEKYFKEINLINPDYTELCKLYADKVRDYEEVRKNLISKF